MPQLPEFVKCSPERQKKLQEELQEEIKTEVYLTSDESSSSSGDESNSENNKSRKGSRKFSNPSNIAPKKNGIRLNVNVGALTIETAEKFKKLDKEIQQINNI